jgi:hypothetical protein
MQKETRFKIKARTHLDEIPMSVWIKTKEKSLRGVPDFLGVVNGWAVCIELKTDDKGSRTDKLQEWRLKRWSQAGAKVFVMRPSNMHNVIEQLRQLPAR